MFDINFSSSSNPLDTSFNPSFTGLSGNSEWTNSLHSESMRLSGASQGAISTQAWELNSSTLTPIQLSATDYRQAIALGNTVDFNGDGRTDFIRQEKAIWDDEDINTANVFLSNSDGSFSKRDLTDWLQMKGDLTNLIVGDYNGDGKTDFIRQEKGAWDDDDANTANVYLSNDDGTFSKQGLTNWLEMKGDLTNLIVGDYNGDGKTDFIRQEKGAWDDDDINTANVYLSIGDGTFTTQDLTDSQVLKGDLTNLIVGDYNGDGKTDFIRQEKGAWDDDDINTANVYLSIGDGTFATQDLTDSQVLKGDLTNLIVGDYNGDGLDDFIRQEKSFSDNDDISTANIYLSNGNGTFAKQDLTNWQMMKGDLTNLIVGDYNGDGLDDFIRQEKGVWDNDDSNTAHIYLSYGDGTFSKQDLTDWLQMKGDLTNLIVGDYNGDGKTDFIRQEKAIWDDDETKTADVYFSNGNGTFTKQYLMSWWEMKGDLSQIITSFPNLTSSLVWNAEYFNNRDLAGNPVFIDNLGDSTENLSLNWGEGSPFSNVPTDNFSARITTQRYLEPGLYHVKTTSDDGIRVYIGNESVIDRWIEQPFATNSGYFYSNGGEYPITIEYWESGGAAALNFELQPTTKFQDPVDVSNQWQATVFRWSQGNQPPTNFYTEGINNSKAIGEINLGSNTRSDGKKGINFDWGSGSLNNDGNRLPHDFFAIRAYTQADFDGSTYKFRVRGDDGFQILTKKQDTNEWFYITPENSWEQAYGEHREIEYTLPAGRYDLHFHYFEGGIEANFDLSWEKISSVPPLHSNPTESNPLRGFRHPLGLGEATPISWKHSSANNQEYAVDFGANFGTPVYAMRSGTVVNWRDTTPDRDPNLPSINDGQQGTTANFLVVKLDDNDGYDDGYRAMYLHLQQGSIPEELKQVGARVEVGDYIGDIGYNGLSYGTHLHVEVNYLTGSGSNMWTRQTVPFQW